MDHSILWPIAVAYLLFCVSFLVLFYVFIKKPIDEIKKAGIDPSVTPPTHADNLQPLDSADLSRLFRHASERHKISILNYIILAEELHQRLLDLMKGGNVDATSAEQALNALLDHLCSATRTFRTCAQFIRQYYEEQNRSCPRISMKVWNNGKVHDFDALPIISQPTDAFNPQDSKAYLHAYYNSFEGYLCNDLPAAAQMGRYSNTRLDAVRVMEYLPQDMEQADHEAWCACWDTHIRDPLKRPDPDSCYKSVLVLPMTFEVHKFHGQTHVLSSNPGMPDNVVGFLVFDHRNRHFFKDKQDGDIDREIGRIFANTLSIYIVVQRMYTDDSGPFQRAITIAGMRSTGSPVIDRIRNI